MGLSFVLGFTQGGVFILGVYGLGVLFSLVYARLIGEILAGLVLGDEVLNFVPYQEAVEYVGQFGLMLLVFVGGLSLEWKKIRRVGPRACVLGVTGTLLPIGLGMAFVSVLGYGWKESLSAGIALSATSMGMATKVLQDFNQFETYQGTLIAVAAVVDDVMSLIILAVLANLGEEDENDQQSDGDYAWMVFQPLIASFGILGVGLIMRKYVPGILAYVELWLQLRARRNSGATGEVGETAGNSGQSCSQEDNGICKEHTGSHSGSREGASGIAGGKTEEEDDIRVVKGVGEAPLMGDSNEEDTKGKRSYAGETEDKAENEALSREQEEQGEPGMGIDSDVQLKMVPWWDSFSLGIAIVLAWGMSIAAAGAGSTYLLGAFVAGMTFASVDNVVQSFEQYSIVSVWLVRIFFASIGFTIPVSSMFTWPAFGYGMLYCIPAILGKYLCGIALVRGNFVDRSIVAWALVGRGELGFVMAQTSFDDGLVGKEVMAIVTWALFVSTVMSPFMFRVYLQKQIKAATTSVTPIGPLSS
eukprot:Nk52_evm17s158 gene=Nk52_evmTU17s158